MHTASTLLGIATRFNFLQRCAATHAYYVYETHDATKNTFEAMSITQVWDRVEVTNATAVYGANEFFFENGQIGYMGGQHTGADGKPGSDYRRQAWR